MLYYSLFIVYHCISLHIITYHYTSYTSYTSYIFAADTCEDNREDTSEVNSLI